MATRKMKDDDDIEFLFIGGRVIIGDVLNGPNGLVKFIEPHSEDTPADEIVTTVFEIRPQEYIWDNARRLWRKKGFDFARVTDVYDGRSNG